MERNIIDPIIENEIACLKLGKVREAMYWTEILLEAVNYRAVWYAE